jgi:Tol biopolymer transport system component
MRVRGILSLAGMALLLAASPAYGQQKPEDLLQSGRYAEEVEGNLRAAVRIFQRIIADFPSHRTVVAEALVRLGRAYETLGEKGAQAAYQRVLSNYPDQAEAAAEARRRLASFEPESGSDPTFALMLDLGTSQFAGISLSRDGKRIVAVGDRTSGPYQGRPGLFVSDGAGAGPRPFLQDQIGESVQFARWSPDGTQIAYKALLRDPQSGTRIARVYVVSADGGEPLQVGRDAAHNWGYSQSAWTPAGDVTTFRRDEDVRHGVFVTVDVEGNTIREVNPLAGENADIGMVVGPASYSPDGRWLAFHANSLTAQGEQQYRSIWAMPATGGKARRLAASTDQDRRRVPGFAWGNEGRSFYVSGLVGEADELHKLTFDPRSGEVSGNPDLITSLDGGRITSLRPLREGGLAYVLRNQSQYVMTGNASRPQEMRTLARGATGQVSPDGRTAYFVGEGYGRDGVFAISTDGGKASQITATVPAHSSFALSPDASAISYHLHEAGGTQMFVLPTQGGEPLLIARTDTEEDTSPAWSPDGSRLSYAHGGDLFTIPAEGGDPQRIAQLREWETWSIRWSPDGKYVAGFGFAEGEADSDNAVFVVPASGGELRRLTPFNGGENTYDYKEGLEWHPDSERLSYMAYPNGSRMAYLDGSPTTLLVDMPAPAWDYVGKWSPDGGTYLFNSSGGEVSGVFAYDVAEGTTAFYSSASTSTMHQGGFHWSWARDGRTFVATDVKMTQEVWLIKGSN